MRSRLFLILALTIAVTSVEVRAGTQNATITGAVYASGVALPGATARLINAGIGFSQVQTTGADGTYTFVNVPPAENYVISVEKAGFVPAVQTDVTAQVGDEKQVQPPFLLEAIVPAKTSPGPPTAGQPPVPQPPAQPQAQAPPPKQSKAPAVSLDLLNTTQSGVEDSVWVHTLPLVNRDFIDLALLVPGTYPVEQGSVLEGASLVVNGARPDMNNFLLDGADNNDYTINQSLPFQIVEALQEFRVQASTENAEYGRSGGAQINQVSRSGSNALHGELFEFNRNSYLSAGNFFSAYSGGTFNQYAREIQVSVPGSPNALTDPTLAPLYNLHNPFVNQNQFGGNIGGALIKDKLFGFFNWESFRLVNPRPLFEQVPGTSLLTQGGCAALEGQPSCDATALALYNLYPAPNVIPATGSSALQFTNPAGFGTPGTANPLGLPFGSGAFATSQSTNFTDSDNFLERIDWRAGSRDSMSFKHNIQRIHQLQGGDIPTTASYPGNGTIVNGRNQNFSYNYVHQFSSRAANEFRLGWNRFRLTTTAQDASFDPTTLGFQNLDSTTEGLPTFIIGGVFPSFAPFSELGANGATPSNRADNVWSYADNFSLTSGRHTWKFGGEYRHIRLNVDDDALSRGIVGFFSGEFVASSGEPDIASIPRICPQSLPMFSTNFTGPCGPFGNNFERVFTTQSAGLYMQDQWRLRRNLTLNYGIRYEINAAPVEIDNRLVNFYPSLGAQGALVQGGSTAEFDPLGNFLGNAPQRAPRAGFSTDYNNWGPRIGFAWDPWSTGKTVVRGGYALMFDQQPLEPSVNQLLNPPFIQQNASFFPDFLLADTFSACAQGLAVGTGGCLSTSTVPGSFSNWGRFPYSITAIDPHNKTTYVNQYHLGIQQQLGGNSVFGVSYVGSSGHRLPQLRDISQCTPAELATCFNDLSSNPFLFSSILNQQNTANSTFNSLQVRIGTRKFHGLQLDAFYEWAKSIDDSSSLQPQVFLFSPLIADFLVSNSVLNPDELAGANNLSPTLSLQGNLPIITTRPNLPQDSNNLAGERGRSDFDIRNRFVVDYVYTVPRWAPGFIGSGWKLAGITTLQSGQPFTVFVDVFGTPLRPNVTGPIHVNNNNPQNAISESSFDFTPTFNLQPGNLGRNSLNGPKFVNSDFAILKDTPLGKSERTNLQFRVEVFNLFNNVNFRQPYSRVGVVFNDVTGNFSAQFPNSCITTNTGSTACSFLDPFFGQIVQAFPARQIQFALKLLF